MKDNVIRRAQNL